MGATFVGAAMVAGYTYLSQKQTVDGVHESLKDSQGQIYYHLNNLKTSHDFEIAKRVEQLTEQSKQFSDTTSRLIRENSLLPKNVELLRLHADKGHQLHDETTQLVVDQSRLTTQAMLKKLQDTAPAAPSVSPGSPLENISCDESMSLIQEITSTLLAKISLFF